MTEEIKLDEWGPEKILQVYDPETKMRGILVIHNTILGPGKGGMRMTPAVSVPEVFRLARAMTWKCSMAGLPYGGAKAGIVFDPKERSAEEKEKIMRAFGKALKPVCPKEYIAAPDVNTGEKEMRWFAEAVGSWKACTGKPDDMCVQTKKGKKCGQPHELGSTGFGVAHAAAVTAKHLKIKLNNAAIAIEGFGNVGSFTANYLAEWGAKIVAASDSKGTIYNENGLDVPKLIETKKSTGSVTNYQPGKVLPNEEIFLLPVDILVPAALPDVINENNVEKITAKAIVQGANIPATEEIENKLHERGILVVPDFVANAGGVISSHCELKGTPTEKIFPIIEKRVKKNTARVLKESAKIKAKPRDVALEIAQARIRAARK